MIEFFRLGHLADTRAGGLSYGQQKLLDAAMAFMAGPRLVLLDEPAAGLPDEETEHLGAVIQKIPDAFGALTILVDHDMSLVSSCCTTTAVLDFGKLIAYGPTADVLREENVIKAYLGTEDDVLADDGEESE
jgi:ABC-type branched-subunit amino acid transport system ATPase component